MADNALIDTINNMKSSGVDETEIKNMLKSMGYSESDINNGFSGKSEDKSDVKPVEAKEVKKELPKVEKKVEEMPKAEPKSDKEEIKGEADRAELASRMAMNVSEAAMGKYDDHKKELESMQKEFNNLKGSVTESASQMEHVETINKKTDDLKIKTSELKDTLEDISAKVNVLEDIMKRILDSQRDILMKLK